MLCTIIQAFLNDIGVQKQIFTTSEYSQKKIINFITSCIIERNAFKQISNSDFSKNFITKFSGRLLIGQNESLRRRLI